MVKYFYLFLFVFLYSNAFPQFALYGTATMTGNRIALTQAVNSSVGGAYNTVNVVNLKQSFTMRFFVNLGSKDGNGADGLSFIFRDANSTSLSAFGASGGGLSYENLPDPFVAIEFDTYTNGNRSDPVYDHVAMMTGTADHGNPSSNLAGPVQAMPSVSNIEDGMDHEIGVVWDALNFEMKVYFDCFLRLTLTQDIVNTIFSGDSLVYFGAIAATGGLNNLQIVEFNPIIVLQDTLLANCGDTTITVTFPQNPVSCSSVSPDGTEFRLQDSTARAGTGYARKYMGIMGATPINCSSSGLTNTVVVSLNQPLYKGYYVLRIKKGNDLTTIGPFCDHPDLRNFELNDIPEFAYIVVKVGGNVDLKIVDSNNAVIQNPGITLCLPKEDPFPLLKGISTKAKTWSWLFNNDTIAGQNVDYVWATIEGSYRLFVEDEFNCSNSKAVNVIFDTIPDFFFRPDLYCDKIDEVPGLPNEMSAPVFDPPWPGEWEWYADGLGLIHVGDTLDSTKVFHDIGYTLRYIKPPKAFGGISCSAEYNFTYDRNTFPPLDPLFVASPDSILQLCSDLDDTAHIFLWNDGLRTKFGPLAFKWLKDGSLFNAQVEDIYVTSEGLYSVMVTDTLGCWGMDSVRVIEVPRSDSFRIQCDAKNPVTYRFSWQGLDEAKGYEISFDYGENWIEPMSSNYHDANSQTASIKAMVRAIVPTACKYSYYGISQDCPELSIEIPNIITPNGDGINDVFEINGILSFPGSTLEVFDRWGTLVYENADYKNEWAGEKNSEGVYFYTLQLADNEGRTFKGNFTIIR